MAWIAVSTSGTDVASAVLLEVAITLTPRRSLVEVLGQYHAVVSWHPDPGRLSDYAREHHEQSGLLEEARSPRAQCLQVIDQDASALLRVAQMAPTLGASKPEFVRAMLRRCLPVTFAALHHRSIDVATLREIARRYYPLAEMPSKDGVRAPDRVAASIATAAAYLQLSGVHATACRHRQVSGYLDRWVCNACGARGTFQELSGGG